MKASKHDWSGGLPTPWGEWAWDLSVSDMMRAKRRPINGASPATLPDYHDSEGRPVPDRKRNKGDAHVNRNSDPAPWRLGWYHERVTGDAMAARCSTWIHAVKAKK